jgi:hypothetical protein
MPKNKNVSGSILNQTLTTTQQAVLALFLFFITACILASALI